jgi:hypothetical protein
MFRVARFVVSLAAFGALLIAQPEIASAGKVMIDSFNVGAAAITVSTSGGSNSFTTSGLDQNQVIGGTRKGDIPGTLPVQIGEVNSSVLLAVAPNPGLMVFDLGPEATGSAILTYDAGGGGLGGGSGVSLNIPGGFNGYFGVEIASVDQGLIKFNIGLTDASSNTATAQWTGTGVGLAQLPFSQFTGVNFNAITKVTFEIVGETAAQDLTLDSFYTSAQVPEPSAMVLFALGAAGFFGATRLRKRRKSTN